MAEQLNISTHAIRAQRYEELLPQLRALVQGEKNFTANVSNIVAALRQSFEFFWVGCYFTDGDEELVLGPFQGPVACTRIRKGKGVCGTVWLKNETIIVPDVDQFPGHIACSTASRSEVVVPLHRTDGSVFGVLDVDSDQLNHFDQTDKKYLEQVAVIIGRCYGE
ncbi:MAG: GAF domain-containing protein [Flavobacteriales bacterium]